MNVLNVSKLVVDAVGVVDAVVVVLSVFNTWYGFNVVLGAPLKLALLGFGLYEESESNAFLTS